MKNKRLMGMIALLVVLVVGGIIYSSVNGEKAPKTNNTTKTVKVGVLQYVSHLSLDLIYKGIQEGLAQEGYKGKKIKIDFMNAEGDQSKVATMSKQLVANGNDVLIGIATPAAQGLASATKDKPIVMGAVTDPVGANLVKDLKKPGGNITGVSDHNPAQQQLELIKQLTPNVKTIGVLYSSSEDNSKTQVEEFTALAEKAGYKVLPYSVPSTNEIASTMNVMTGKVDAIWIPIDNTIASAFSTVVSSNQTAKKPFPDMTTEGSFPLGGAVAVTLISKGINPFLATAAAILAGCLAGMVTGLLYTKGKIPTLLSGILVMTSCHSIMLMLMGRANLGLLGTKQIQDFLPFSGELNNLLTGLIFVSLVIAALLFFLDTKLGQAYIATGDNPDMASSFGIHTGRMELMGLVLSNGVIALAGALIAQQEGYADVSRGIGVIVVGLASLIIGEVLFTSLTLAERLLTIVVGSIFYQFLIWGVIALGFNTSYLRLYSAVILAICLMIPTFKNKFFKGVKLSK